MRKELDDQLCRECPNLYADRHASISESCFAFGFEHMDGWFNIVREMSLKLEAIIMAMPEEERGHFKCAQCKEKFAFLHFYMTSSTPEMDEIIRAAEKASYSVCEYCGQPGSLRTKGWLFTLCDKCDQERPWRKK